MFEKILVPLDGSRFSSLALPYAAEISKRFRGELVLLQVVQPTSVVVPTVGDAVASPMVTRTIFNAADLQDKRNISRAKRYLGKKLHKVTAKGVRVSNRIEKGDPAKVIISLCKKESIDLVAMTTSGKGGLKRTLLGSVADKVIREPGIHVLAIRPGSKQAK